MLQEVKDYIQDGKEHMDQAIEHLKNELVKIRAGKASPSILNGIYVDYYGSHSPLNQVANVNATDSKTINIQPWDKSMLTIIEKAIFEANLGITPMNDGENIRLNIPALTEERRKDLVKQSKALGEETKVSLRNTRHKLMDFIKKKVKEGYPEDGGKQKEEDIQKMINTYGEKVDELIAAKEKDIMTI